MLKAKTAKNKNTDALAEQKGKVHHNEHKVTKEMPF